MTGRIFFGDGLKELSLLFTKAIQTSAEVSMSVVKRKGMTTTMTKIKVGGIVLGGLAGYLLLSKGINAVERGIKNICTANQWKNYYKYGKDGNMVPPGYNMHTSMGDNGDMDIERNTSQKAAGSPVSDAIAKAISDVFKGEKAAEEASEGQTEASGETDEDCPGNCSDCKVEDCPYEYHEHKPGEKKEAKVECPRDCLRCNPETEKHCPFKDLRPNHGIITEWTEDGQPKAGCYAFNNRKDMEWEMFEANKSSEGDTDGDKPLGNVVLINKDIDQVKKDDDRFKDTDAAREERHQKYAEMFRNLEEAEPFYRDDLTNGVKVADSETDEEKENNE